MSQVNFYALSSNSEQERLLFACRLTEKILALGHRILIRTDSPEQTRQLDALLWEFRTASFVPHAAAPNEGDHPVLLSHEPVAAAEADVLINLADSLEQEPGDFARINEIIDQREEILQAGRARYRHYQSQGLEPQTHKI